MRPRAGCRSRGASPGLGLAGVRVAGAAVRFQGLAALAGAAKVASEIEEGTIVFIVCDGGWKYLSTGAYTDDLDEAEARAEKIIYF